MFVQRRRRGARANVRVARWGTEAPGYVYDARIAGCPSSHAKPRTRRSAWCVEGWRSEPCEARLWFRSGYVPAAVAYYCAAAARRAGRLRSDFCLSPTA